MINKCSSRSHCIYKIKVKFSLNDEEFSIYLVDLAGVERNKSYFNCDEQMNQKIESKQLHESKNINLSLSTLIRCFRALKNNNFLPYWDSMLTKIIFEEISKEVLISFVITFDPNHEYFEDNKRVLEFSALAKGLNINVLWNN